MNEIETWIEKKYIKPETAAKVWTGFQATTDLRGKTPHIDWKKIKEAYTDHYLKPLKEGSKRPDSNRKAFRNHMSQFKIVSDWLKTNHPGLTPSDVELRKWQESMLAKGYTASTVNKRRSALSVILKVAVEADMILRNPLDKSEPAPIKTLKEIQKRPRRPMSGAEAANTVKRITEKLDLYSNPNAVPNTRKYPMNGCLPIAFFEGWYMGLRNEEVRWSTWDSIDYDRGVYYVQATTCITSNEEWVPKDDEAREIKIIDRMMEWFNWERERQKNLVIKYEKRDRLPPGKKVGDIKNPSPLGQFIIPSGTYRRPDLRGRPVGETALRRSFTEFINNEVDLYRQLLPTFYSGRHTHATEAARAGMKPRDLQARMGHADLRTTMKYIEAVRAEESTIEEDLPY